MKKIFLLMALGSFFACNNKMNSSKNNKEPYSAIGKKVTVITTAKNNNSRLTPSAELNFTPLSQPTEGEISIFIDPDKTYQNYFGIGAALTDASAETFYKMPKAQQEILLSAFFNKESGIGYSIARTNINSCDFSSSSYTYVKDGDKDLSTFNIAPDLKYKIPFIKEAMQAAGGKLHFYASPWSPPAYMKDNNDMLKGGKLLPEYYETWAMYFTKFIKEYEKLGMPMWGISVQNEPMAVQKWESCIYTAEEERDFIKNYLGPIMKREGLASKKIIAWDHNRDMMYQRAQTYFDDPEASKYIWGIGFHWYEDWSGGTPMYDNVRRVHEAYPDKNLFFTEGCAESFNADRFNAWELGEEYGRSMINDFNNGMVGFTDWNIFLDETGGPNHVQNFCFAPVHADTKTGKLIFTNAYYYIGHFSKYLKENARRISASSSRSQLLTTAFKNPDGKLVVLVMNQGEKDEAYNLWINGQAAKAVAPARSMSTLLL